MNYEPIKNIVNKVVLGLSGLALLVSPVKAEEANWYPHPNIKQQIAKYGKDGAIDMKQWRQHCYDREFQSWKAYFSRGDRAKKYGSTLVNEAAQLAMEHTNPSAYDKSFKYFDINKDGKITLKDDYNKDNTLDAKDQVGKVK
tara:strand:- start:39 stop:464 length:426 start_codon:yes stop_codon:yes gene_type:complete